MNAVSKPSDTVENDAVSSQTKLLQSCRILMVEDDADILRITTSTLIKHGFQVITAENGSIAWDTLQTNRFDLVITDHNMPVLTGLDLVKRMRRSHIALPVILASGSMHTEELEKHPWIQLAATLLKPFTNSQLLDAVSLWKFRKISICQSSIE
jgi:CheY-like chemotaxis protein